MSEEDVRKAVEPLILEYFENSDSMEVLFTLQEMLPNLGMKGIISTKKNLFSLQIGSLDCLFSVYICISLFSRNYRNFNITLF